MVIRRGTDGPDTLTGTSAADTLDGLRGDDTLWGRLGGDTLWGRRGEDTLHGEGGDDRLDGAEGVDFLIGGGGADGLFGGLGHEELDGGEGDDTLVGGVGSSADYLFGDDGADLLYGGDSNDILWGGLGHDRLYGGDGADLLRGGDSSRLDNNDHDPDTLVGDAGGDWFQVDGRDRAFGGMGDDVMSLRQGQGAVALGEGGGDTFEANGRAFATVTGGPGADFLSMASFVEASVPTRVVFTDFADGEDRVRVHYRISLYEGRDTADFIDALDRNGDDLISRADGRSGATEHEAFAFSRDSAGENVLTLSFAEAAFVLQGADYLA